jgi:hypothetical protein
VNRERARLGALFLFLPLLLGAHRGTWRKTAESHLQFARELAAEGIVFNLATRASLVEDRLAACEPRPSKVRTLPLSDLITLQRYGQLVCVPSLKAWIKGMRECTDRLIAPRWCHSDDDAVIAEHLSLGAYFETMTAGIAAAVNPLERANIIGVLEDFQRQEFLPDHVPLGPLRRWIGEAATVSLRGVTAEEGVAVAVAFTRALGGDGAFPAVRAFRDSAPLSEDQRCILEALLSNKDSIPCPGYVEPNPRFHQPAKDEEAQELQSLQEQALRPDNLRRLRSRVETFMELTRDRQYGATYDMLSVDLQEVGFDRELWVRKGNWFDEEHPLVRWRVEKILILGNKAKVLTNETRRHLKGREKGTEFSASEESFWILEEGDWRWGSGTSREGWQNRFESDDPRITEVPVDEDLPR